MGKKRSRTKYTSKGLRTNVSNAILKFVARQADAGDKLIQLHRAWKKGRNPWLTVENASPGTNRPFTRVRSNDAWGDPKRRSRPESAENAA